MDTQNLFERLGGFRVVLPALVSHVSELDARWKPADGAWSILEVVCHLVDEEVEDFRTRVQSTLRDPTEAWPPIDPEATAIDRDYNSRDLTEMVQRFVHEREASIAWLEPQLEHIHEHAEQAYLHPRFGPITVGELFCAWVAHDQMHIRQIAKRLFQLTQRDAAPFSTRYAGD